LSFFDIMDAISAVWLGLKGFCFPEPLS